MIELRIASPCTESWESMKGDERVRFCALCKLNVFNVKELSEAELRALFVKTEGKLCGRVYQRKDGTVLTRDCPTGVARLRRKALAGVAVVVTLVLAVVGFRASAERSCPAPDEDASWFSRLFDQRFIDARESLRETRTFGPIIDELYPPRPTMVMGKMVRITPVKPLVGE
jgi:hypothetical protein